MAKAKRYITRYLGRTIEMSRANSSMLIYRIPYQNLNGSSQMFEIDNPFIVYILYGKNDKGRDVVYIGKSKNGLKNRPRAHEGKYGAWSLCYVLTQFKERTFFNDGTIQYLEDRLNRVINDLSAYENTTMKTASGTANRSDEEDCDEYLEEALQMLDVLGLDLITHKSDDDDAEIEIDGDGTVVPDGKYYFKRRLKRLGNKEFKAEMQVSNGKYILLKGSEICESEGPGLMGNLIVKRNEALIVDGVLKEDIILDSPSAAGSFVIGASCNGWTSWKCENGKLIDVFRNQ